MGAYDLQAYLYYLANQLKADNDTAASFIDRATRMQDEYLYRKEASRNRRSLHSSPRIRAPRYDKRKHKYAPPKKYPAYKLEESKKKNEERKEEALELQNTEALIEKASNFRVQAPSSIDLSDNVQRYCWVQSLKKVASEGKLLNNVSSPNYDFIMGEYYATLNEFGDKKSNFSNSRLYRIMRKDNVD